jgi:hypothetical protein
MKAFFDTSVLVGAFNGDHPRHTACLGLLADASKKTHFCAAHSAAELYSVMTCLPVRPRITSEQGLLFVENVRDHFSVITLNVGEQFEGPGGSRPAGFGGRQDLRPAHFKVRPQGGRRASLHLELASVHTVSVPRNQGQTRARFTVKRSVNQRAAMLCQRCGDLYRLQTAFSTLPRRRSR